MSAGTPETALYLTATHQNPVKLVNSVYCTSCNSSFANFT